jgi:hypothetical protein
MHKKEKKTRQTIFYFVLREKSVTIDNHIVCHFPARVYDGLEDLAETILNSANCCASKINVSLKDNPDFTTPKHVYVYTDIIKPNLVGDLCYTVDNTTLSLQYGVPYI